VRDRQQPRVLGAHQEGSVCRVGAGVLAWSKTTSYPWLVTLEDRHRRGWANAAIGPEPHPIFVWFLCQATLRDGHWAVEGERKDADGPSADPDDPRRVASHGPAITRLIFHRAPWFYTPPDPFLVLA
jgi:hypothetical protein